MVGLRAGHLSLVPPPPGGAGHPAYPASPDSALPGLDLFIDDYQRAKWTAWVNARLDKFNWLLFQELRVNLRTGMGRAMPSMGQQCTLLALVDRPGEQRPCP